MTCKRCDGSGYVVWILKARSVGISTTSMPPGNKVPCPDCNANEQLRSKVPEDLKDKPWAWDMYFKLKEKEEAKEYLKKEDSRNRL